MGERFANVGFSLYRAAATVLVTLACCGLIVLTSTPVKAGTVKRPEGRFGRQVTLIDQPVLIPDYTFSELMPDGATRDWGILEFRGQVALLNFWATWCGVCRKEMPKLDRLAGALGDEAGIKILALSIDDRIEQAQKALSKRGHDDLRVFHDTQKVLSSLLGVRGVPTTFVVGKDGRAIAVVQGPADWESPEARAWLEGLAKSPVGPFSPASADLVPTVGAGL